MLQAVLIQPHHRLIRFTGKGCDPSASLKPLISRSSEDRLGPVYRHPKGFIQYRRMIGTHRPGSAEHPGSFPPSLAEFTELDVDLCFIGSDGRPRKGETGDDGMGNSTDCADAAQNSQHLSVIVFVVPGVLL